MKTTAEKQTNNQSPKKVWTVLAIIFAILGLVFFVSVWIDVFGGSDFPIGGFCISLVLLLIAFLFYKFRFKLSKINGEGASNALKTAASIGKAAAGIAAVADIADSVGDLADNAPELEVDGADDVMSDNTTELNDFQKTILAHEQAEVETKEKLTNFLNNAYGRDVSEYVD